MANDIKSRKTGAAAASAEELSRFMDKVGEGEQGWGNGGRREE